MRLDYGTLISPSPISLSIGNIRKPTLKEISEISFETFSYYEFLLSLTPLSFFTQMQGDEGKKYWDSLSAEEQKDKTIYDVILADEAISQSYLTMLNFFFIENIFFEENMFVILHKGTEEITLENICGVISKDNIKEIIEILQQICCIYKQKDNGEKFKNKLAKKLYEKMAKAEAKKAKITKADLDLTVPNIISALANKHPSLNYTNIWDLTVYQLIDSFNRTQTNSFYEIDSTRVSVWGDKDKAFKPSLWYKNNYDNKST